MNALLEEQPITIIPLQYFTDLSTDGREEEFWTQATLCPNGRSSG